jgi:environmental stress-induced protein Ves
MQFKIILSTKFETKIWSGGTSKELYIYPENAEYLKRNFQFRLSTAKVETEKSDFTKLEEISRKLMILDGKILLCYNDTNYVFLNKFDIAEFEGNWKTTSIGKCTDFNLMTSENTKGELKAIEIEKGKAAICEINEKSDFAFIYVYSGKILFKNNTIISGDLIVISENSTKNFEIKAIENSEIVFCEIK